MPETIEQNATVAPAAQKPRLMDRVRETLRVQHYALSTERNGCRDQCLRGIQRRV